MSERKYHFACISAVLVPAVLVLYPAVSHSLEVGFEGRLLAEASDNIEGAISPNEEDGSTVGLLLGVYGEQRGLLVNAGFQGEIDTRRDVSVDDSSFDTITRFLGAAEFSLTPRSWRWYVGDILGGVRRDNAIQSIDDTDFDRRNVFVTGPSFEYDINSKSRTRARLLYIHQSEESDTLETLYSAGASYERDTTPGSYFGFRLRDIYTNLPDDSDNADIRREGDFNRTNATAYWNRAGSNFELYGEVGVTRYDADDESLNGMNAELSLTRQLGPSSSIRLGANRDLYDNSLSTLESLIGSGTEAVGLRPEVDGFFLETSLLLEYSFNATDTSFDLGVGVAQIDYQLLGGPDQVDLDADSEDQLESFAYGSITSRLSPRIRGEFSLSYEQQTYDNRMDESDSILAEAKLITRLSRSFELETGVVHDSGSAVLNTATGGSVVEENIDMTENRFRLALRWAPPSRASKELTVELKSLLR